MPTSGPQTQQAGSPVGQLLRDWRSARGLSQLDLAMQAGFSARHVSFIETGRTQPSRQALLVLAETLDVPLRERNRLLEAGGYAHVYRQTPLAAEEMASCSSSSIGTGRTQPSFWIATRTACSGTASPINCSPRSSIRRSSASMATSCGWSFTPSAPADSSQTGMKWHGIF
jgi:transcriptional regulator with XRE-family HTH domain